MFGEPVTESVSIIANNRHRFLAYRKKIFKEPGVGLVSSRTGVGSGSVRGFSDHTLGKNAKERAWGFEIKSEYGAVIANEMRDLFESTSLRHRVMWLDGPFGSKLKCLKRIS